MAEADAERERKGEILGGRRSTNAGGPTRRLSLTLTLAMADGTVGKEEGKHLHPSIDVSIAVAVFFLRNCGVGQVGGCR